MRDWRKYVREHLPSLNLNPAREIEIVEELAEQLDAAYRDNLAAGQTEAEAIKAAEAQIPNWRKTAKDLREATGAPDKAPWWSGFGADARFGLRLLARQPMFSATVILTLAVGLGACVAIYSLLEAVVIRSLPFRDPQQLVMLWEASKTRGYKDNVVAPADFRDWQARTKLFESMSAYTTTRRTLTGHGEPVELNLQVATPNHLTVLGVQPSLGRDFRADENRRDSSVILLGHAAWQRHFGGRPDILGQKVMLSGNPYDVIGVLPADYPVNGVAVDALALYFLDPASDYRKGSGRFLMAVGRLKPGVTPQQGRTELQGIAAQLEHEYPDFNKNWTATAVPLADQYSKRVRAALWILMFATGLVLLIACANVANLLLARGAAREREIAIRCSMGASGWRVARQLFVESLTLALAGGITGLALAAALIKTMKYFAPDQVPRLESANLNPTVLAFAFAITAGTGLLFGLAPALALARTQLANTLKEGARGILGSAHGDRWRSALVIAEIALALILLVASGLLMRAFAGLMAIEPGFDTTNVLTMQVGLPATRYTGDAKTAFYTRLNERVRTLPGVVSVGSITWLPFDMGAGTGFRIVGRPTPRAGEVPVTDVRVVHPGYFETMRIPLKQGRFLTAEDNRTEAPRHFIVNEALATAHFPNQSPIGQKLIVNMGDDAPGEIVGVIANIRVNSLSDDARAQVYYPHAHLSFNFASLVIRTHNDPMRLAPAVIREIRQLDPLLPATEIQTMEERVAKSVAPQRFLTALLAAFSMVALFLALIGIYGVMSYTVEQRTHEIGVRLALGAAPGQVQGLIVGRGLLLAVIGTLIGIGGSVAAVDLLTKLPFDVKPSDPASYAIAVTLLLIAALLAVYLPARRATRVDPMVTLRYE